MSLSTGQQFRSSRGDLMSCPSGHTLLPGSVPDLLAAATPRSPAVAYRRDSSCPSPTALAHALASSAEAPAAPRLRYSVTLVVGVVGLILLVGFLAWNIPFTHLQSTVEPLGRSIRTLVMASVDRNVRDRWAAMRAHAMFFREKWDLDGQPEDPVADVNRFGRLFQPLMRQFPYINIVSFLMLSGRCVTAAILQQQPSFGWRMTRQNCSVSWAEPWDALAGQATGRVLVTGPRLPPERLYMFYPLNMSSRAQPFTWLPVYDPVPGNGKLFLANIALFVNGSNVPSGRLALGTSSADLSGFLQQQVQGQPATLGGRMALYDPRLIIVATTHGDASRPQITAVGDADLEAAARAVLAAGQWCSPMSTEITLSQRYFLDVDLIADPQPSVVQLQWCAILLSPRDNTMQQVDHSTYFAVAFVCAMTFGSATVAVGLGVLVTQPLHCLTKGMRALKEYDFACARQARLHSRVAWFREMHSVMDSYGSLVDATYAFGKYVPHDIVRGLLAGWVRPQLGMAEEHLAVCFMDVAHFTTMCETIPANEIVTVTTTLFDRCCGAILNTQGTIDKFIGDCIMCLWGAPVPLPLPEALALRGVLDILSTLQDEPIYLHTGQPLQLRVGLNAGRCLVGNFGASTRWEYTAIGDVVNTASRLEALNKQFATQCLASAAVVAAIAGTEDAWLERHMRPMGDVLLVGKANPVPVYEVRPSPLAPTDLADWQHTLELCRAGRLPDATHRLEALEADPGALALLCDVTAWTGAGPFVRAMRGK